MTNHLPRLVVTMGDVAGVGPEIIAKAWPALNEVCRPIVIGDPDWMRRALTITNARAEVVDIRDPAEGEPASAQVPCLRGSNADLRSVETGRVSAAAGRAAHDFLCTAVELTLAGAAAGIVTAPLHKEGLRAAGVPYPGHTEILAARTGTQSYAMVLHGSNLTVIHVTLHMALREVFRHLSTNAVLEKIRLLNEWLPRLLGHAPRLGVAALNPHAGDGGLFGSEEATMIEPAVAEARREGIAVTGPWPCDTLFVRARDCEFDGIIVMYHDQGHIAMKLLGIGQLVNVTVGLPLIRTSVAHGTAYDIAGRGIADPSSLIAAARVAARLASFRA
jgi:4-hydroxythreonine-4-phosphate dehydrogenase